jgi:hypothetical protein
MKHLRLGGLVAAMAVVAAVAVAGTASATVLCKESKVPCGAADYPAFTEFKVEQMPENTTLWREGGVTVDTCEKSLMLGKTQNTGGSGSAVNVLFSTFTWGTCGKTKKITELGEMEIRWQAEGKGTLILKNLVWEEGTCVFGAKLIDIGVITKPEAGKTYSTLLVDATYPRISGFGCLATTTWAATYKVTAPSPLYIAES